jgi:hypothetical protein
VKLHNFSTDIKTGESEVCYVLHILVSCCIQITCHVPVSIAVMWMSFYDTNLLCFLLPPSGKYQDICLRVASYAETCTELVTK